MSRRSTRFRVSAMPPVKPGGHWRLKISPPFGHGTPKKKRTKTTSETEAWELAPELEQRLNAHILDPGESNPLVLDVYDVHVAFRSTDKDTKPTTLKNYRSSRKRLAEALEGVRASDLDPELVKEAQNYLKLHLDNKVVNQYLRKASHAWNWAHELRRKFPGVLKPWPKVKPLPETKTKKRAYEAHEAEAVLAELAHYNRGRYLVMFLLFGENGARNSELCQLKGWQVERRTGHILFHETKTEDGIEKVAVSEGLLALIPRVKRGEYVFPACRDKSKPLSPRTVLGALHKCLERAGLKGEPLDTHSFRRYVVRKLHTARVPLKDAMEFIRHTCVRTHLGYMDGAAKPDQHEKVLEEARREHDLLGHFETRPGVDQVEEISCLNSLEGSPSRTSAAIP